MQQAAKINNLLDGMVSVQLEFNKVVQSEAIQRPAHIGRDNTGRQEVIANYSFTTYMTTGSLETSTGYGGDKDPNLR